MDLVQAETLMSNKDIIGDEEPVDIASMTSSQGKMNAVMMNKVIKDLIMGKVEGETSMSITLSDLHKHGKATNLFEKFQNLQDKIDLKEQMIKMAK